MIPNKPVVVRDVISAPKPRPLPAAAKAGHLTSRVKAAPQRAAAPALSVRRIPAPKAPPKVTPPGKLLRPALVALPQKSQVKNSRSGAVLRRDVLSAPAALPVAAKPRPVPKVSAKAETPSLASRSVVHAPAKRSEHSTPSRASGLSTCKERPKSNKPSGGSGGGSRAFVPWCG